jgi:hypothetical protein
MKTMLVDCRSALNDYLTGALILNSLVSRNASLTSKTNSIQLLYRFEGEKAFLLSPETLNYFPRQSLGK